MDILLSGSSLARSLLSGGGAIQSDFCFDKNVTYEHRVDNPEGWNWCLTPDGGYDAVFFAGLAIVVMCLASPRWDALVVLFFGGIYFTFSHYFNLEHVSNAVALWLGMRPADIFVYVFLPPFLLDLSVRIDFFMLKKMAFNVAFMAFVMVAASALILIPFMLYALDLQSSGWTAAYVALFGSMIASTDAASVSAVLRSGGGPEVLSVLLEGESLFNDASSLTLFEIFKEVVLSEEKTTLAHDLQGIVVKTIWSAFTGICVGLAMGIVTRWMYAWLQHRNMEAQAEVAWSVAGAYLSFYITQVWCTGSGCIGAVAYGLYGSATLLWGMSTKARLSGIFSQFWAVMTFIINGLIFFYVGASSVNFTIRSSQSLYNASGGIDLVKILLYKLPLIFLASFSLRFILIFSSFKLLQVTRLSEGLSLQEVVFVTVGGLRGSLSLVLAQSAATLASSHPDDTERRVKAEIAIYTAGYVVLTLLVNAPLCGPLLTLLGLDKVRQEQLAMRGEVKNLFRKFTGNAIEDLAAGQDEDELLQGLDWAMLRQLTDFDKHLDKELPEVQPSVHWFRCTCAAYWRLVSAPARLLRWLRGQALCAGGDSLERDLNREEEATRQKLEADLRRATNFNVRDLANASRAPGSITLGGPLSAISKSGHAPAALIIRDPSSAAAAGVGGSRRNLLSSSASTTAAAGRRAATGPPHITVTGLRGNSHRRMSTMVVSGAAAGGGGGDGSVRNGGFGRSASRFIEGAVAGPTPPATTPRWSQPPLSAAASLGPHILDGGGGGDDAEPGGGSDGGAPLLLLPPPPPALLAARRDLAAASGSTSGAGAGADGGEDGGGGVGLLDPRLIELTEAGVPDEKMQRPAPDGVPAAKEPAAAPTARLEAPAPAAAVRAAAAADRPPPSAQSQPSGGDSMIEAALSQAMAAEAEAEAAAVATALPPSPSAGDAVSSSSNALPQGASPAASAPLVRKQLSGGAAGGGPSSPRSTTARPSPLSRKASNTAGGTLGPAAAVSRFAHGVSGPLTRATAGSAGGAGEGGLGGGGVAGVADGSMHHSASAGDLQAAAAEAAAAAGGDGGGGESTLKARGRAASAMAGSGEEGRELLQSILVIRPGAGGRTAGMPMAASGLRPSASVRLVQRLGDEGGRGSGLEALRADAAGAAGARQLGRSSVRAAGPAAGLDAAGMGPEQALPSPVRDRPLGRGSLTAPAAGRPLARISGVLPAAQQQAQAQEQRAWEPPSLGPYEFALPEDLPGMGPGPGPGGPPPAAAGGAATTGRASFQRPREGEEGEGGGGGLARSSVRTGGGGGGFGALGRTSVRVGRQAGLAAASAHLARIYDAEAGAADGALARPSFAHEGLAAAAMSPHRGSISGGPGGASSITAQVSQIAAREAAAQQQQQQQPSPQRATKYSLGTTSKGALLGLIRRSVTPGAFANGGAGQGPTSPPTRDPSGRGADGQGLGRRTRFADTSSTAAALARASASGGLRPQGSDVESGGLCAPLLVEYRMRLLAGLKQYYRQKHAAGSLSPSSYKVLSYVADQSAHHPERPLQLWSLVRQEVGSGPLMQAEANCYFKLKHWTAAARTSESALVRGVVPRLLVPFVWLLSSHISATTLRGLETAVELWASLTQSLQTEWLQYSGVHGELLLEEVQHEADGAWSYIIERRIEAPNKFGAVQTHRAVIDVLTQQQAFVREMNEGGMIDESECRKIVELVERRLQLLARRGPRWRQPTVSDVLSSTPFLRGVPPRVVDWIRKQSKMVVYQQGAAIWDMGRKVVGSEPDGLIIVVRGVVRMMVDHEGTLVPYYLGTGGVGGLVSCVLEDHVPGMSSAAAYAEGNAMGKGPVVMHVPWSVLQVVRRFSREECMPAYQALELQLYRTAAVYVLDLLRHQVTHQFSAFIRSSLLTILASKRLDGPTVRRQRIRLLLQPAAADHHVDGGIDWISELLSVDLPTARLLLEPPAASSGPSGHFAHGSTAAAAAAVAAAITAQQANQQPAPLPTSPTSPMLPAPPGGLAAAGAALGNGGGSMVRSVAVSAWVEAMYKAIAAATGAVLDVIRSALKDASLVVLPPGQGIVQRTTMVLIQGSLEPAPLSTADGSGGGPFVASPNEHHLAPSVLVWVSDYFEGELVAQRPLEVVAGPRGATLLVWGIDPEGLLMEPPPPPAPPASGAATPPPPPPAALVAVMGKRRPSGTLSAQSGGVGTGARASDARVSEAGGGKGGAKE